MGVGGIDGSLGHVGEAASLRTSNTLRNIGSTAFNVTMSGAQVAAGMFGGPAGSAAVSGLRSAFGSVGSGSSDAQAVGSVTGAINESTEMIRQQAALQAKSFSDQMLMFELQKATNSQSEQFNTLTNITKSKHDAAMAAIQNTK